MEEFLSRTYYGNTVLDWAIAFGIIIAALIVGKVVYWLSSTVFRQLTKRTKTNLDDIILDMVEEPIVFALTVAGVWYGLRSLNLPELAHVWIGNVIQFLVVLAVAWMVTRSRRKRSTRSDWRSGPEAALASRGAIHVSWLRLLARR